MENNKSKKESFFSVSFDLILLGKVLPYDLYINSSSNEARERFVRIFPSGEALEKSDLVEFRRKYHQLYILEKQRDLYLKSLVQHEGADDIQKTAVIKDSAIHYLHGIFDNEKEFTTEVLAETVQGCRDSVESMVDVIEEYNITQVQNLIGSLSFHDFYTYDHSINVSMYSISIFKALKPKASKEELITAGMGGLLHDLGKIKIPTRILNNPGKLSDEDFEEIKNHPEYGSELFDKETVECCNCDDVNFEVVQKVIYEHHENVNGTGYPNKVKGKDIHVMARVTAIADFFDAITTKRSYHEVLSTEDALEVMARSVGRKIDPKIFEVFVNNVNIVLTGNSRQELPDDFDSCMPHNVLPLKEAEKKVQKKDIFGEEEKKDYGTVKSDSFTKKKEDKKEKKAS